MIHTRHIEIEPAGSAATSGTIGVPPQRYAGCYLRYTGTGTPNLHITNMGRDLLANTAAGDQFIQDLKLDNELLVNGQIVATVTGASAGSDVDVEIFVHQ